MRKVMKPAAKLTYKRQKMILEAVRKTIKNKNSSKAEKTKKESDLTQWAT